MISHNEMSSYFSNPLEWLNVCIISVHLCLLLSSSTHNTNININESQSSCTQGWNMTWRKLVHGVVGGVSGDRWSSLAFYECVSKSMQWAWGRAAKNSHFLLTSPFHLTSTQTHWPRALGCSSNSVVRSLEHPEAAAATTRRPPASSLVTAQQGASEPGHKWSKVWVTLRPRRWSRNLGLHKMGSWWWRITDHLLVSSPWLANFVWTSCMSHQHPGSFGLECMCNLSTVSCCFWKC